MDVLKERLERKQDKKIGQISASVGGGGNRADETWFNLSLIYKKELTELTVWLAKIFALFSFIPILLGLFIFSIFVDSFQENLPGCAFVRLSWHMWSEPKKTTVSYQLFKLTVFNFNP